jgi:hypothetical protein
MSTRTSESLAGRLLHRPVDAGLACPRGNGLFWSLLTRTWLTRNDFEVEA